MFLWKYDGCGLSPIADILIVPPHGQLHGGGRKPARNYVFFWFAAGGVNTHITCGIVYDGMCADVCTRYDPIVSSSMYPRMGWSIRGKGEIV